MEDKNEDLIALREALRLSEERFQLASKATNDAVWDWNLKTGELWWGSNYFTIFQYSPEEVEFGIESWETRIHPEDRERVQSSIRKCLDGDGTNWSSEYRYLRKDGTYRDILDRGFVQRDPEGKPSRMVGAMMDVSQAKHAELELQRLNSSLEERVRLRTLEIQASHEALEAFTYSVSHDLRAPLRHITGFLQLLARGNAEKLDADGRRYLGLVLGAAEKMAQLIDALLSFSRVGKTAMHCEEVNLEAVLKEVIQGVSGEIRGREVKWLISPLPKVWADLTLIRQVLVNLLENAVKYTRPRRVTEIEVGVREEPTETVLFVKDNGVGFDMKYVDKLFGVFQRLHSERDFEGNGVGLANVKRIIGRHGGRVWAEGEVEKGACFFFTIPRHPVSGERGGER